MSSPRVDWLAGQPRTAAGRAAVLAAAREHLLAVGLTGFSVDAVAARAGCSRATLYRLTGGKAALLERLLAEGAADVAGRVATAVAHLAGPDRAVEAVLVALREVRADPALHAGVRGALLKDDSLVDSPDLVAMAGSWLVGAETDPLVGTWILRVFLQFVAWPAEDAATEAALVRRFLTPALGRAT